jgi:hypothetical protein
MRRGHSGPSPSPLNVPFHRRLSHVCIATRRCAAGIVLAVCRVAKTSSSVPFRSVAAVQSSEFTCQYRFYRTQECQETRFAFLFLLTRSASCSVDPVPRRAVTVCTHRAACPRRCYTTVYCMSYAIMNHPLIPAPAQRERVGPRDCTTTRHCHSIKTHNSHVHSRYGFTRLIDKAWARRADGRGRARARTTTRGPSNPAWPWSPRRRSHTATSRDVPTSALVLYMQSRRESSKEKLNAELHCHQ